MTDYKSNIEIKELVAKVRKSDVRAQRKLYDLLVLKMYNTVHRVLANREDTLDCLQNGFASIFKKINNYDADKGAFVSWATRIFINEALGMIRKRKMRFEEISDNVIILNNESTAIDTLEAEYIMELIADLPDQYRIIFNLYEIEGYSHKEIAQKLNIGESSSRTYLTRAKLKLKKQIRKKYNMGSDFKKTNSI